VRTLIADDDHARAKGIAEACIARGLVVENASHGAAALEMALERVPDMVICPIELPIIDAIRLAEILRGNPRTRGVGFVFLVEDEFDAPIAMDPRDVTVPSPWLVEDVLHHVDAALERNTRFGSSHSDSEISGKLTQISLADLLQIFQMNRKTGALRVVHTSGKRSGAVLVRGGQVIDATIPLADGTAITREKALYRMLTWRDGRFEFLPGDSPGAPRIQAPSRTLLLEGMRQKDELERNRGDLPAGISRLRVLAKPEEITAISHAGVREMIGAVGTYQRVSEIVDHCRLPDYQVLCALSDLLGRGILAVERPSGLSEEGLAEGEGKIFSELEVRRLREWSSAVRPRGGSVIKVPVLCGDRTLLEDFRAALAESDDFSPDPRMAREPRPAGNLGHFPLGDGLSLRLIALPAEASYAPLLEVIGYGMLGAIVLSARACEEDRQRIESELSGLMPPSGAVLHLAREEAGEERELAAPSVSVLPRATGRERLEFLRGLFARLLP
jgi:CheY-like chemotaxis protein